MKKFTTIAFSRQVQERLLKLAITLISVFEIQWRNEFVNYLTTKFYCGYTVFLGTRFIVDVLYHSMSTPLYVNLVFWDKNISAGANPTSSIPAILFVCYKQHYCKYKSSWVTTAGFVMNYTQRKFIIVKVDAPWYFACHYIMKYFDKQEHR